MFSFATESESLGRRLYSKLVRFRDPKYRLVGVGALVSQGDCSYILTCAHVVNSALGYPKERAEPPPKDIFIQAELLSSLGAPITSKIEVWLPMAPIRIEPSSEPADVALLLVTEAPEYSAQFGDLNPKSIHLDETWKPGEVCWAFGYPEGHAEGIFSMCLMQIDNPTGRIQIAGKTDPHYFIKGGFSGSPVFRVTDDCVLGMIVTAADPQEQIKQASIIPAKVLKSLIPSREPIINKEKSPTLNAHRHDLRVCLSIDKPQALIALCRWLKLCNKKMAVHFSTELETHDNCLDRYLREKGQALAILRNCFPDLSKQDGLSLSRMEEGAWGKIIDQLERAWNRETLHHRLLDFGQLIKCLEQAKLSEASRYSVARRILFDLLPLHAKAPVGGEVIFRELEVSRAYGAPVRAGVEDERFVVPSAVEVPFGVGTFADSIEHYNSFNSIVSDVAKIKRISEPEARDRLVNGAKRYERTVQRLIEDDESIFDFAVPKPWFVCAPKDTIGTDTLTELERCRVRVFFDEESVSPSDRDTFMALWKVVRDLDLIAGATVIEPSSSIPWKELCEELEAAIDEMSRIYQSGLSPVRSLIEALRGALDSAQRGDRMSLRTALQSEGLLILQDTSEDKCKVLHQLIRQALGSEYKK